MIRLGKMTKNGFDIIKNAKIPFLEVARKCKVSGAAIHQRVQRLVRIGVITGSEYILNPKKIGYFTCAYMGIFLDKASLYYKVVDELEKIPEIIECHYTTGTYSIFVKIFTKNNDHLRTILADKLQSIEGIARTESFCRRQPYCRPQYWF